MQWSISVSRVGGVARGVEVAEEERRPGGAGKSRHQMHVS